MTPGGRGRMTEACGMRNGAGTRPPSGSDVSGCRLEAAGGSRAAARSARSRMSCRSSKVRYGGGAGPRRAVGTRALRSGGPVSRERLSAQQWARLELELRKGPLAHGFANDQRWTLGRIKTLIGRLFHVGYTIEGTSKLMGGTAGRPRSRSGRRWNAMTRRSSCGKTRCGPI